MKRFIFSFVVSFYILQARGPAMATVDRNTLDEIARFSSQMCEETKQEGSSKTEKIEGDLTIGLSGLLRKLGNAGVNGKSEYVIQEYKGVLQKDLSETLADIRRCKIRFGESLIGILSKNILQEVGSPIVPGNQPTPKNSCTSAAGPGALIILMGSLTAVVDKFPHKVLTIRNHTIINMDRDNDGNLLFDVSVFGDDGREIVRIEKNRFVINQNNFFGMSRPDGLSSLDVVSRDMETVLRIRFINEKSVSISGKFRSNGITVPIGQSGMSLGGLTMSGFCSLNNDSDVVIE